MKKQFSLSQFLLIVTVLAVIFGVSTYLTMESPYRRFWLAWSIVFAGITVIKLLVLLRRKLQLPRIQS